MGRPFSERVAGEEWRREAESWIGEQTARHGHTVTGPVEQPRIRPWSTQLTVPTDAGRLWFKANCASAAFEPRLHMLLARLVPDAVDEPYAIEPDRGWMLTVDRGATLGDSGEPTVDDWSQVVTCGATLQRLTAEHREAAVATGMPDCGPATVVVRFDHLVDTCAGLADDHPGRADPDLAGRLRAVRPAVVDAAQLLEHSSLPTTFQHGDVHPWNVFAVAPGALRLFDFGDAQWAHALEMLSVPYGWITSRTSLPWSTVLDAYCETWGLEAAELRSQWTAAGLTQSVNRSMTWWRCLAEASPAEWDDWGDAPMWHLSRVLDP